MSVTTITPLSTTQVNPLNRCHNPNCTEQVTRVMRCSHCLQVSYCGRECQKKDWQAHKIQCQPVVKVTTPAAPAPAQLTNNEAENCSLYSPNRKEIGEFSENDYITLGLTRSQMGKLNARFTSKGILPLSKRMLACFEYALLELGERGVEEQLFRPFDKSVTNKCLIEGRLKKWGYEIVASPQARDLVLYYDETDLQHMGNYLGNGLVNSKFGSNYIYSTVHLVKACCHKYGWTIVFFRKNPQLKCTYMKPVYHSNNI